VVTQTDQPLVCCTDDNVCVTLDNRVMLNSAPECVSCGVDIIRGLRWGGVWISLSHRECGIIRCTFNPLTPAIAIWVQL